MSGDTGGGTGRLTGYCLGTKRFIVCIKDYIICLFASFCESIVLIKAYIVCSFANGDKGNAEASARDIRARDARVSIGNRLRLGIGIIGSLSQVSSSLKMGMSVKGSVGYSYDYNIDDRDIFSLRRVTVEEGITISSFSYIFELLEP